MRLPTFFVALTVLLPAVTILPADLGAPRTIEVVASRFKFEPALIEVEEGERIQLRMRSTDSEHGFAIKEFKVKQAIPKTGEVVSVDFVAGKVGSYPIVCSEYCGSGHGRMRARLLVRPRGELRR